jgi:hypothetical protein
VISIFVATVSPRKGYSKRFCESIGNMKIQNCKLFQFVVNLKKTGENKYM